MIVIDTLQQKVLNSGGTNSPNHWQKMSFWIFHKMYLFFSVNSHQSRTIIKCCNKNYIKLYCFLTLTNIVFKMTFFLTYVNMCYRKNHLPMIKKTNLAITNSVITNTFLTNIYNQQVVSHFHWDNLPFTT